MFSDGRSVASDPPRLKLGSRYSFAREGERWTGPACEVGTSPRSSLIHWLSITSFNRTILSPPFTYGPGEVVDGPYHLQFPRR